METTNKIIEMFDMDKVKKLIQNCPKDEIVILCGYWSINRPKYEDDTEAEDLDFSEFEDLVGYCVYVNDFDDLCIDVHGIMND